MFFNILLVHYENSGVFTWKPGTALAEAMQISRENFVSDEIHKLLFGPASTALLSFSYLVFKESL